MKCIVCNASYEMSEADRKQCGLHEPAYCSVACFIRRNDGRKPGNDDLWNIHTGPVTRLPPMRPKVGLTVFTHPSRKHASARGKFKSYL